MDNDPTYEQTANSWGIWAEYVDPEATMTEQEFDAMSTQEKIELQTEIFGVEEEADYE